MKRHYIRCIAMVIAILATGIVNATELTDKLASLTEVSKVKELKSMS